MLNFGLNQNSLVALAGCGKMSKFRGTQFRVASKEARKMWKAVKEMRRLLNE